MGQEGDPGADPGQILGEILGEILETILEEILGGGSWGDAGENLGEIELTLIMDGL